MHKKYDVGSITDIVQDRESDRLLIPAQDIVNLVRGLGRAIEQMSTEDPAHDAETAMHIVRRIRGLADQLDVYFIQEETDNTMWFKES
jgi:hypothetical protein